MAYTKDIEPNTGAGSLKAQVEAQRNGNTQPTNKYEAALAKYNCNVDEAQVAEALKRLIAEKVPANDTVEVKKFLFGSVELTSLSTADYDLKIMEMVQKVNRFDSTYPDLPHVATICVYPNFAEAVKDTLEVEGVEIAVVSGSFPSSQTFIEVKVAETALTIKDGATNVDIVMPVGKFLCGDYEGACDEISELKQTCGDARQPLQREAGVAALHVCGRRLHQDFHRQRQGRGHAAGRLRDVPGHQGVLRQDGHPGGSEAGRRHQHRDGCRDLLHDCQGSSR